MEEEEMEEVDDENEGDSQFADADEGMGSRVKPGEMGQWGKGDGRERRAMSEGRRR